MFMCEVLIFEFKKMFKFIWNLSGLLANCRHFPREDPLLFK